MISSAARPELFEPFKRPRDGARRNGLGIGLYITRELIAAHAGTISVRSSHETGTIFQVSLPRASPDAGTPAAAP